VIGQPAERSGPRRRVTGRGRDRPRSALTVTDAVADPGADRVRRRQAPPSEVRAPITSSRALNADGSSAITASESGTNGICRSISSTSAPREMRLVGEPDATGLLRRRQPSVRGHAEDGPGRRHHCSSSRRPSTTRGATRSPACLAFSAPAPNSGVVAPRWSDITSPAFRHRGSQRHYVPRPGDPSAGHRARTRHAGPPRASDGQACRSRRMAEHGFAAIVESDEAGALFVGELPSRIFRRHRPNLAQRQTVRLGPAAGEDPRRLA